MIKYFLVPGFNGSGADHWQSYWAKSLKNAEIIEQDTWGAGADKTDWITKIEAKLMGHDYSKIVLIGQSLGVAAIIHWAKEYGHKIRGALLVAPTDVNNLAEPIEITGFSPIPLDRLTFKSIIVASTNDIWIGISRAREFAKSWGSEFEEIGAEGHINSDSRLGEWPVGRAILERI